VSEPKNPLLPYVALVSLALIWGVSFLFIKIAVQDMSPTAMALIRTVAGSVALAAIMLATRRPIFGPHWRSRIVAFVIMAITNALIPWIAIAWGEEHISSGLASILNSTTTLWTAILIFWVIPMERPSPLNYVGVLIGVLGVVILVLPDLLSHGVTFTFLGVLSGLGAAFSYAIAALYARKKLRGMDLYQQSLGQLVVTSILAIPIAAPALPHIHFTWLSMASVIYLGVFGSGIAYLLYYYTMNTLGAVRAAGVTLLVPVTAVFWGVVLLHETLSWSIILGMAVILSGIVLTNLRRVPRAQPAVERDSAVA
jgi:drug/metabolite transporter (DMT)-like permease